MTLEEMQNAIADAYNTVVELHSSLRDASIRLSALETDVGGLIDISKDVENILHELSRAEAKPATTRDDLTALFKKLHKEAMGGRDDSMGSNDEAPDEEGAQRDVNDYGKGFYRG